MTLTLERPTYAGTRRFADRPAEVRRPRHRAADSLAVVVLASLADALRDTGRAAGRRITLAWAARMTARTVGVLIVATGLLLGGGALVIAEALPGVAPVHPMIVVTPEPTPHPGGWSYAP